MIKFIGVILALPLVSSCYSVQQAYHFNNLFNSRIKIDDILQDTAYDKKPIKKKLRQMKQVMKFASKEGLNTEGAYRYYIHSDSGSVSFLVQAAYKRKLKFKTWWFPFVGRVPYLGFFEKEERNLKYQSLKKHYDVSKGGVGAFSSLGWFDDPVYTSMLKRSPTDIAHLFFHELVHRTYWSRGSVRFNENLAEFCAEKLTKSYLLERGKVSEIEAFNARRRDKNKYKEWLKFLRADLKILYQKTDLDITEMMKRKQQIIDTYKTEYLPAFETKRYAFIKNKTWNNASILGASLYTPDTKRFLRAFECSGQPKIAKFIKMLKKAEQLVENHFLALDSLCEAKKERG